jgi:hypothetical protein
MFASLFRFLPLVSHHSPSTACLYQKKTGGGHNKPASQPASH